MRPAYEIRKVYKRYWWPHPYAKDARLLWVKVLQRYRYFVDGRETDITGKPLEAEK